MASLLDAIKGAGPATGGKTETAQSLLTARQTGKASGVTSSRGPARAAEGERIADSVAAREQDVAREGVLGKLQSLQQNSDAIAEKAELTEQRQNIQHSQIVEQAQNRTSDLLEQVRQQEGQLNAQKKESMLNQAVTDMRLSNVKYLDRLQSEGRKQRLDNEIDFKKAMQEAIFADQISLLEDSLAFQEMMNLDDIHFNQVLASIDIDTALQMASDAAKAANTQAQYSGASSLLSGGLAAYDTFNEVTSDPEKGATE